MKRIQLGNTVFEGENSSYLFTGSETVLVDTGIATPETRNELKDGLAEHDVSFADIDTVLLTHYHGDHSGLAGEIQAESSAPVYAHHLDAPLAANDPEAWDALHARQRELFHEWGMPTHKRDGLIAHIQRGHERYGDPVDVDEFDEGDTFEAGDTTLEVMHTPGHTCGLSSFVIEERNEVPRGQRKAALGHARLVNFVSPHRTSCTRGPRTSGRGWTRSAKSLRMSNTRRWHTLTAGFPVPSDKRVPVLVAGGNRVRLS